MNNFIELLLVAAAGLLMASAREAMASDLYNCNELSLDAFGFTASRDKGGGDHQVAGPGAGVNYFFNEFLGIGGDTYADAFTVPYLLNGSVIGRYPITGSSLWISDHIQMTGNHTDLLFGKQTT